jgi:hypothetical protein
MFEVQQVNSSRRTRHGAQYARIVEIRRLVTKLLVFHIDHKKITFWGEQPVFEYRQIMEQAQWQTSAM